jgi:hypothetical protein
MKSTHNYKAKFIPGEGIFVGDEEGNSVKVNVFPIEKGMTAYVEDVGYIGGWRGRHFNGNLQTLVDSINKGILVSRGKELPF